MFIFRPYEVSPLVERFAFPKNLTRGKRLRVICTVSEGDLPLDVDWWKDGVLIGSHEDKYDSGYGMEVKRIDEYTSLLAISFLETTHAGNYSCVATNSVATYSRSATLTIRGTYFKNTYFQNTSTMAVNNQERQKYVLIKDLLLVP